MLGHTTGRGFKFSATMEVGHLQIEVYREGDDFDIAEWIETAAGDIEKEISGRKRGASKKLNLKEYRIDSEKLAARLLGYEHLI